MISRQCGRSSKQIQKMKRKGRKPQDRTIIQCLSLFNLAWIDAPVFSLCTLASPQTHVNMNAKASKRYFSSKIRAHTTYPCLEELFPALATCIRVPSRCSASNDWVVRGIASTRPGKMMSMLFSQLGAGIGSREDLSCRPSQRLMLFC